MQTVWHIVLKDARGLRAELSLLGALAVLSAWSFVHLGDASWAALTAAIAANYVIVRLIHADPIAGEAPFWITRPYPPHSMLFAKLLFLALFIQLPTAIVDLYVIAAAGFSIPDHLGALITDQILMFVCCVIPVACLASLTSGLVEFLFAEVAAFGLMFLGFGLTYLGGLQWIPLMQAGPPAVDWIRSTLAAAVVTCVSANVLFRQYTARNARQNRLAATGGAIAAAAMYLFLPWTAELGLQTLVSSGGVPSANVYGTLEKVQKSVFPIRGRLRIPPNEVNLPIAVHGLGADDRLVVDALYVRLSARSGREGSGDLLPVAVRPAEPGQALVNAEALVDGKFFAAEALHPVSLHAALYLTVFGRSTSATIPIRREAVEAVDGLQCSEGTLIEFRCSSPFRWPARLVSVDGDAMSSLSYSPFPASPASEPIEARPFSLAWTSKQVTVSSRAPIAHVRTEIDIPNVVLANYTLSAKLGADRGIGINVLQ